VASSENRAHSFYKCIKLESFDKGTQVKPLLLGSPLHKPYSFHLLTTMLPIVLVLGGTVALFYYITKAFYDIRNRYPADIPLVEPPPGTKYEDVVKAQYAKVWSSCYSVSTSLMRCIQDPDQIYILRTRTRDVFMLPPRYMKEFAWLREDRACKGSGLCCDLSHQ
jgi:hypothetical protein